MAWVVVPHGLWRVLQVQVWPGVVKILQERVSSVT